MSLSRKLAAALFVSILALTLMLSGCQGGQTATSSTVSKTTQPVDSTTTPTPTQTEASATQPAPGTFLKGISLTPRSMQGTDFQDFFVKAKQAGQIVTWAGQWSELGQANGGPTLVATLAKTYGYIPVIMPSLFKPDNSGLAQPLDATTTQQYLDTLVGFIKKFPVPYLGLGVEINTVYQKSPSDYQQFVTFFSQAYDAVKAVSPNTRIFTVFQLERMKGLNGGLFGGTNDASQAEWQLLNQFPKADFLAFTSYPGIIYKTPADIPADYYSDIANHTDKKIAFTELGWQSSSSVAGWPSTPQDQADFVDTFFKLSAGLNREMVIWSFLYDPPVGPPFDHMGLFNNDNTPRPAWARWLADK